MKSKSEKAAFRRGSRDYEFPKCSYVSREPEECPRCGREDLFCGLVPGWGEFRGVSNPDRRNAEATRLGFETIIMPLSNPTLIPEASDYNIIPVGHLNQAFDLIAEL
jgi:predicted ATP-dependent serine protease